MAGKPTSERRTIFPYQTREGDLVCVQVIYSPPYSIKRAYHVSGEEMRVTEDLRNQFVEWLEEYGRWARNRS